MTKIDAINALIMCQELMLFDPMTGEAHELWQENRDNQELYNACGVAIAALREQADRESGCEWCKTPSHNPDIGGCTLVFYRSKAHPIGAYAISVSVFNEYGEEQEPILVQIDNCIHCGKRLEGKQ